MRTAAAIALVSLFAAPVGAEPLAALVAERAGRGLPPELAVTDVHLPRSMVALDVARDQVSVEWPTAPHVGRSSVKVRLRGRRARTVFVPVTLAPVIDVAVATRDLAIGERVAAADVRIERRAATAAMAAGTAIGQEVTAAIRSGEVLDAGRLVLPPLVARGTAVTVRVRRGAVQIETRGRLEAAARPGESARVRLDAQRAPIDGTLVSTSLVTVGAAL